jgi:hypothetical protein
MKASTMSVLFSQSPGLMPVGPFLVCFFGFTRSPGLIKKSPEALDLRFDVDRLMNACGAKATALHTNNEAANKKVDLMFEKGDLLWFIMRE